MTEPVAAIDLGSNTFKLTIASVVNGSVTLHLARAEHVRISEGLQSSGRIREERMALAVATIQTMCTEARSAGARSILVVGTAALRMASNTSVLIDRVRLETGMDIDVISSEREARLTTAGALSQLDSAGDLIIVDIGGASTELIHTRDGSIAQWTSLPIGSGLLTDQLQPPDPPSAADIARMEHVVALLATTFLAGIPPGCGMVLLEGVGRFLERIVDQQGPLQLPSLEMALKVSTEQTAGVLAPRITTTAERARVVPAAFAIARTIGHLLQPTRILIARGGLNIGLLLEAAQQAA